MDTAVNEPTRHETTTDRTERELIVTRTFDGPARHVFAAWTRPELIMRWWAPASFGITFISCEADVRTGGTYRYVFGSPQFDQPVAFHGRYLEVVPNERIVWTNEESDDGHTTTVTFEEKDGKTLLTLRDSFPTKEALDAEMESGAASGYPEQFNQLDILLPTLG
jgi:uncharacterized protein YndB with AHSA1/START domain